MSIHYVNWPAFAFGLVAIASGVFTTRFHRPITRQIIRDNERLWGIAPNKWKNTSWAIKAAGIGTCSVGVVIVFLSILLPPVAQ